MNRRRDVAINQTEPVIAVDGVRLIRKCEAVQSAIKPVSRSVTGKGASGTVAAMRCRRESNDQQACTDRAEAGDGSAPVFLVAEASHFHARDFFPVRGQPWTKPAILDFVLRLAVTFRQVPAES